jgi:hypothetical protein
MGTDSKFGFQKLGQREKSSTLEKQRISEQTTFSSEGLALSAFILVLDIGNEPGHRSISDPSDWQNLYIVLDCVYLTEV